MMKSFLLFAVLFIAISAFGQPGVESTNIRNLERSPSAPTTANLGKYFDVPVNMANGVPNISIPLYTIQSGNISVPISLSYHGQGIRVNTPISWVGLGWDLNFGGMITKQVNGLDDFHSTTQYPDAGGSGYPAYSNYFNPDYSIGGSLGFTSMSDVADSLQSSTYVGSNPDPIYRLIGRIILNQYDGESDEYHFSTPEGSGTIFYNQKTASFQFNKFEGWKIAYGDLNDEWFLKGTKGLHYTFTARERSLSPIYNISNISQNYYTSAWYLTEIEDVANNREVLFTYDQSTNSQINLGQSIVANYSLLGGASYAGGSTETNYRTGNEVFITKIDFPEGRIEFIKDTATITDGGPNALRKIKIYDKDSVLRKQFDLSYYYAWSANIATKRFLLKSVQEVDYTNGSTNHSAPYLIYYDTTNVMPAPFSYAQDIWGFNNGKTSNTTLIPNTSTSAALGISFADRRIDTNYTKTGIITRIVYPTGGSLNFTFENNRDEYDSLVGGLRIKRIVNYDSVASSKLITEYRYNDDNGHSTGTIQYRPSFHYTYGTTTTLDDVRMRFSAEPLYPLVGNMGGFISYGRVEKIEVGDTVEFKSRYYFDNNFAYNIDGAALATYQNNIGVPRNKLPNIKNFTNINYKTEVFKKQNGQYKLVQKDTLSFKTLNQFKNSIWNLQASWVTNQGWVEWTGNDPYAYTPMNAFPSVNAYKLFQESLVNDISYNRFYDDNSNLLERITWKKYDIANGNLKRTTTIASNGDTMRTYISYAIDYGYYPSSSDAVNLNINHLQYINMIGAPIEVIATRQKPGSGEYVTDATLYIYSAGLQKKTLKMHEDGVLLSSFTQASNNSTAFSYDSRYVVDEEIVSFDSNSNPEEINVRNKAQSFIWDKDDITAFVQNASVSDIAATSFETGVKGKWTYSGTPVSDPTAITGSKAYLLSNGSITRSSLNSSKTYIVSYWSKNGPQTVNSASPVSGRAVGSWTYYEHKVVNPSSGLITVSGSGTIDELRIYPLGSLMTTFTYKDILGMASQCDPQNKISYYEYDGLGRLRRILDQGKNVVKVIDYQFKQNQNQ